MKLRDSEGMRQSVRDREAETGAATETGTHRLEREGASIDRQRDGGQRERKETTGDRTETEIEAEAEAEAETETEAKR